MADGRDGSNGGRLWMAALAATGLAVGMAGVTTYLAYKMSRPRRSYGGDVLPEGSYEDVTFESSDGLPLSGWVLPSQSPGPGIVLCHGFHTSRREMLPVAQALRDRGYQVLLFDFRAHGASEGLWTSCGLLEERDLKGASRYLLSRPDVVGDTIGALGFSMGAAVTLLTAADASEIGAVAADSGFATLRGVVPHYLSAVMPSVVSLFAPAVLWTAERLVGGNADSVRPVQAIGRIAPRPVLLIHGAEDGIVPLQDAYQLYDAAGEPRQLWVVPGASHVGAREVDFEGYVDRIDRFFRTTVGSPADTPLP